MRNIRELLEASKEDLPSVYCDMDMVLCDFLKGAEKVIGMPFPLANKTRKMGEDIWIQKTFGRT